MSDHPYEQVTLENTDERWWVHREGDCRGDVCAIHKRSDHNMRSFPQHFRADRALMERICDHGVGHPDPDDLAFHEAEGDEMAGVHGCDGCCNPEMRLTPEQWVKRFLVSTPKEQLQKAEQYLQLAEEAECCWREDHVNRITYLSAKVADLNNDKLAMVDRFMGAKA